jgi:hypothetical protein
MLIPVLHQLASRIARHPSLRTKYEPQCIILFSLEMHRLTDWVTLYIDARALVGINTCHAKCRVVFETCTGIWVDGRIPDFFAVVVGVYVVVFVDVDAAFVRRRSG